MGKSRPSENTVSISGYLGADAERGETKGGTVVANIFMAVNRNRRENDDPMWIDVVIFGGVLDAIGPRLRKGALVFIRGELNKKVWTAEGGKKMSKWEVVAGDTVPGSKIIIFRDAGTNAPDDRDALPGDSVGNR